jgi:hypothetical protein
MVYLSNNDWSKRGSYTLTVRYLCNEILARNINDDLPAKFISNDEENFNINSTEDLYHIHVWATENPHVTTDQERDSTEVNVLFAISKLTIYVPFSFLGERGTFTCLR